MLGLLEVKNYWWINGCLFQKHDPQRLHLSQYLISFFPSFFFHWGFSLLCFVMKMLKQSKIDHNQLSQNIVYISISTIKIIVVSRQLVFSVSGAKKPAKLSYFIVKGSLIISVPFKWVLHTYLVSVQAKQGTSLVFGRIKGRATHLSPSSVGCWAHLK